MRMMTAAAWLQLLKVVRLEVVKLFELQQWVILMILCILELGAVRKWHHTFLKLHSEQQQTLLLTFLCMLSVGCRVVEIIHVMCDFWCSSVNQSIHYFSHLNTKCSLVSASWVRYVSNSPRNCEFHLFYISQTKFLTEKITGTLTDVETIRWQSGAENLLPFTPWILSWR